MNLNPQELHYFKRELIARQLEHEIQELKRSNDVSSLVNPSSENKHYPFLQYISKHFVLEFPLLKNGDERGFFNKVQAFLDEYSKLKLNNYAPKSSRDSQRRVLIYKIQKLLIVALSASIKTVQGKEESIDLLSVGSKETEEDALATKLNMTRLESEEGYLEWMGLNGLQLNVVTVRDVSQVRTIREHIHSEFIVKTELVVQNEHGVETTAPVFVAKRHGQFRQLRDDLKAAYPTLELPNVPSKAHDSSDSKQLHREKDRIMLRLFLRRLAAESQVANSEIFRDFLLSNPVQLTAEEQKDAENRAKMDENRAQEEKRFREQVDKKIVELDGLLNMLKQQIMKPNGLIEVFEIIKKTNTINQLPPELRKAIEWGRINFAFVLHTQFVTSDRSVENTANLKRTHSLMPYRAIAQVLKLSNPFYMVKGVLDLFLAQPFGGKSLFQRIVLANMSEETKELTKDIEDLQNKINDPPLCQKIANAVQTELPEGVTLDKTTPITETLEMLKDSNIKPILTPQQILKVAFANQPGKVESRELVENLYKLWVLYARKQEQELLMALVFQGVTGEITKDLFAIFYEPLAQVYKAANIGDTIGHVSGFINDLIEVIDKLNVEDVSHTAQPFIDLVQRHEEEFYQFVHNVHAQDQSKLFDSLLGYVNSLFSFVSNGIPTRIDIEQIVSEAGISDAEYPELKKEINAICDYHLERKKRHLERKRQKMMSTNDVADSQEMFEFLPENKEVMSVFNDMADIDYDSEDDERSITSGNSSSSSSSSLAAHEMTLRPPTLHIVPKVSPIFVEHVKKIMY
ncbi:uncharacterized protein B0P05DRAFT_535098 [Gilbertella persicaria]|uniref:uncharacterized protein n=1 Tax=Gilbertella persicaria TaxID=101096 RepID=UPI00221E9132|nr:uncharacterized protein B0P05DRAFT_535098 [Gilbertella persicaria]KAI8084323.1 hypothetical protein B0P05DRAFT_535098 [Gilbertella persicaria]